MDELYGWIDELHAELSTAKSTVKAARKDAKAGQVKLNKAKTVASKQLDLLKCLKINLYETKDMLADESHQRAALEQMRTIKLEIKKERPIGRGGSSKQWPVHIVLLICKMLGNGTDPKAVPANIQTPCALFTGVEADELPSVNFVRECRVGLQKLNETLSAF